MPQKSSSDPSTRHGGCHCCRMRFEVGAPIKPEVLACNCSICTMTGFLHLIVPVSHFNEREAAMAAIAQLR